MCGLCLFFAVGSKVKSVRNELYRMNECHVVTMVYKRQRGSCGNRHFPVKVTGNPTTRLQQYFPLSPGKTSYIYIYSTLWLSDLKLRYTVKLAANAKNEERQKPKRQTENEEEEEEESSLSLSLSNGDGNTRSVVGGVRRRRRQRRRCSVREKRLLVLFSLYRIRPVFIDGVRLWIRRSLLGEDAVAGEQDELVEAWVEEATGVVGDRGGTKMEDIHPAIQQRARRRL